MLEPLETGAGGIGGITLRDLTKEHMVRYTKGSHQRAHGAFQKGDR
jgi:hypothetical protein